MTQFQILFDAIDLLRAGRKHSAKAQWKTLSQEFRSKVTEFLISMLQCKEPLPEPVDLRCRYGEFTLSNEVVQDLKTYLPELILNANA